MNILTVSTVLSTIGLILQEAHKIVILSQMCTTLPWNSNNTSEMVASNQCSLAPFLREHFLISKKIMQARAFDVSTQLTLRSGRAEIIPYFWFSAWLQIFHFKTGKAPSVLHQSRNKFALLVLYKHQGKSSNL